MGFGVQEDEGRAASAEWYPPLERTLLLLSKLYRSLDSNIFTGLAQVRTPPPLSSQSLRSDPSLPPFPSTVSEPGIGQVWEREGVKELVGGGMGWECGRKDEIRDRGW